MALDYRKPGVYVEESLLATGADLGSANTTAFFAGIAPTGPAYNPVRVENWSEYVRTFGGFSKITDPENTSDLITSYLPYAVYMYFQNGGRPAWIQRAIPSDDDSNGEKAYYDVLGDASETPLRFATNKAVKIVRSNVATIAYVSSAAVPFAATDTVSVANMGTSYLNDDDAIVASVVDGTTASPASETLRKFTYPATGANLPGVAPAATTNAEITNNVATITSAAHGLSAGDTILMEMDTPHAVFDGIWEVLGCDEVQTVEVDATGGTWTITFDGETTATIATNATAATVKSALEALPNVETDDITVGRSGSANDYTYTFTFKGQYAGTNVVPLTTGAGSLTGGAGTATVTQVTAGGGACPSGAFSYRITNVGGATRTVTNVVASGLTGTVTQATPVTTAGVVTQRDATSFRIQAQSPADLGTGGTETLSFTLVEEVGGSGIYTLRIYKGGQQYETFRALSMDSTLNPGTKNFDVAINDPATGSALIEIEYFDPNTPPSNYTTAVELAGGVDPNLPIESDLVAAAVNGNRSNDEGGGGVEGIRGPLLVNVVGYSRTSGTGTDRTTTYTLGSASAADFGNREDVFIINDRAEPRGRNVSSESYMSSLMSGATLTQYTGDSYVAAYTPWIVIANPSVAGTITVPPGGAIAGVMGRVDATIGAFRAPAGLIAGISGCVGVDTNFTDAQLGTLNAANVNVIRPVPGTGVAIMGARTRKLYGADRYVSARRTLIYIKETLRRSTEFALFENNDQRLWSQLIMTAERVLRPLWLEGGLRGNSASEAYFIKCDSTVNTPQVISAGEVRMEIGVALEYPAEFIIIRVSQFERTSSFNEVQPNA